MGRHAYLVRMALGRSAYDPVDPSEPVNQTIVSSDPTRYIQQYDSKGNPQNPETAQMVEAQISAKNEVLAAVGVCEKKNKDAEKMTGRFRFSDDEWKTLREAENDYGELVRMVAECSRNALTWWISALRRRVQIGLLPSQLSFSEVLAQEWISCTSNGLRGAFKYLSAGTVPELAAQVVLTMFDWVIGDPIQALERRIIRLKATRRHRYLLLQWLRFGSRCLTLSVHMLVYPLSCYSSLQQLGLVPSSQPWPAACILPWYPASPLRWAFYQRQDQTPNSSRILSCMLSPAALWVTVGLLHDISVDAYGHVPLCEQEAILGPHEWRTTGTALFTPVKEARDWMLRALGWSADQAPQTNDESPDHALTDGTENTTAPRKPPMRRQQRVNELSMLPSHFLALNLDNLFWNIALLPLDAICLRALASSYLASPLAQTHIGRQSPNGHALASIVRKPLTSILIGGGWSDARPYTSKIGLCLALQFMIDTAIWGATYSWARWAGLSRFHWGAT